MKNFYLILMVIIMIPNILADESHIAIVCGQIIDGKNATPLSQTTVLIKGEKIVAIGSKEIIPNGTKIINLGSATLLPGLIDVHTHPLIGSDEYQIDHLKQSSAFKALRGLRSVQNLLMAGWTSIRIAGDADVFYAHLDVKKAIDKGLFIGPRITGAGHYISITGGGGDINFFSSEQKIIADGLIVDGVEEMRKAVRKEIKYGSEWIKLLVTGAFMSAGDNPRQVHFSPEEIRIAVEEANRFGVPVMAHAHSAEGIKQAVRAGVRSIEHGTFIDPEGIKMMKERGTYLVPTLCIGDYYLEKYENSVAQKKMIELTKKYRKDYMRRMKDAVRQKVKIGVGSDLGGYPDSEINAREFALLVELGMTPMQAIQAGTKVNAELLGWDKRLGTIEPGKLADLIAVVGNPIEDISELERVIFVMIGGKVVKNP